MEFSYGNTLLSQNVNQTIFTALSLFCHSIYLQNYFCPLPLEICGVRFSPVVQYGSRFRHLNILNISVFLVWHFYLTILLGFSYYNSLNCIETVKHKSRIIFQDFRWHEKWNVNVALPAKRRAFITVPLRTDLWELALGIKKDWSQ